MKINKYKLCAVYSSVEVNNKIKKYEAMDIEFVKNDGGGRGTEASCLCGCDKCEKEDVDVDLNKFLSVFGNNDLEKHKGDVFIFRLLKVMMGDYK
jgi:hypothetical protein